MLNKEIYPKTARAKCNGETVCVTEKLDGSNLVIFKKNGTVYIAQRKNIIAIDELDSAKDILYKGLSEWLNNYKEALIQELHEGSAICGEWLGMGRIKYNIDDFDKRWYMFAKANVDDDFNLYNLNYNHDDFIYPFESQEIPKFIGIVPVVSELKVLPDKRHLDSLYEKYTTRVKRNVEGFVVSYRNQISKYVRMKNGKLQEHHE